MSITGGMQGTLGGMALVYMYTATDQGFGGVRGCYDSNVKLLDKLGLFTFI